MTTLAVAVSIIIPVPHFQYLLSLDPNIREILLPTSSQVKGPLQGNHSQSLELPASRINGHLIPWLDFCSAANWLFFLYQQEEKCTRKPMEKVEMQWRCSG